MTKINIHPHPFVEIIDYTGAGHPNKLYAAALLAFTKGTRLKMSPEGFSKFLNMPEAALIEEMDYMSKTIPSSWEFVDITFSIQNVSRACAQQITRTRTASYAMQSQRVTDMSEVTFHVPDAIFNDELAYQFYCASFDQSMANYRDIIKTGASLEDARGLLPINAHCNLIAKYNLRTLVDLLRARDSLRVQGEYREVAKQMRERVFQIWPWAKPFFEPKHKTAISMIEEVAVKLDRTKPDQLEMRNTLAKAADLIKK